MSQQPDVPPQPDENRQHAARDTILPLVAILLSLVSAALAGAITLLPSMHLGSASAWIEARRATVAEVGIGLGVVALVFGIAALLLRRSRWVVRALAVLLALAVTVVSSGVLLSGPTTNLPLTVATALSSPTPARLTMLTESMPYPVRSMIAGPDGAVWFAGRFSAERITTLGEVTQYAEENLNREPTQIVLSADGNFWMPETLAGYTCGPGVVNPPDAVAHISSQGVLQDFPLPPHPGYLGVPQGMAADPSGGAWYVRIFVPVCVGGPPGAVTCTIGRVSSHGSIAEFQAPQKACEISAMVVTPDGNAWLFSIDPQGQKSNLVRVVPTGAAQAVFVVAGFNFNVFDSLIVGPDHNVWFSHSSVHNNKPSGSTIYRVTPSGSVSPFVLPSQTEALNLADGLDGAIWYVGIRGDGQDVIGRITTSGAITQVPFTTSAHPAAGFGGVGAATPIVGSDGNVWYASTTTQGRTVVGSSIVRVTPRGVVTVFPVPVPGAQITALIAGPGHAVWFATLVTTGSLPNQSYSSEIGAVVMGA